MPVAVIMAVDMVIGMTVNMGIRSVTAYFRSRSLLVTERIGPL